MCIAEVHKKREKLSIGCDYAASKNTKHSTCGAEDCCAKGRGTHNSPEHMSLQHIDGGVCLRAPGKRSRCGCVCSLIYVLLEGEATGEISALLYSIG